ncbi:MAG TPA: polymer-forming cytoskeletal protein [Bacteroidetes bacterium]|nr:polymer-forming cytoskeletal protein [Bacteroidota bacterium]
MLGKKDIDDFDRPGDLNTIIGKGTEFDGTLKVQSSIRIDGRVKGKISTTDSLIVGKEGEIDGEVTVKNAIIGGKVKGKIHASGKIVLEAKSYFYGELKTAKLVIDEGAMFEGVCSMGQADAANFSSNAKSLIGAPQKSGSLQGKK